MCANSIYAPNQQVTLNAPCKHIVLRFYLELLQPSRSRVTAAHNMHRRVSKGVTSLAGIHPTIVASPYLIKRRNYFSVCPDTTPEFPLRLLTQNYVYPRSAKT